MTTEKMLEKIMRIAEAVRSEAHIVALMDCDKLINELKTEISAKTAKQAGKKEIFDAAMKILKSGAKENPVLAKALIANDGSQIIMDYCRAVKFSEPLDVPANKKQDYKAEKFANSADYLIKDLSKKPRQKLTSPTITELKNFIAIETAAKKARGEKCKSISYALTPDLKVEARLFVEMLQALPDAAVFVSDSAPGGNKILYLKAKNGIGIILPLLKNDD